MKRKLIRILLLLPLLLTSCMVKSSEPSEPLKNPVLVVIIGIVCIIIAFKWSKH